jgi:prepilin signal peptidase PulO-like enzyme (type II secretory pathway)
MYIFILCVLFFLIGLFCGSLVSVIAGGLTREPRAFVISNCRACNANWPFYRMVPIAGFILSRGKCKFCNTPIKIHILLVELGTGLLFAYLAFRFGLTWELSLSIFYALLLLIVLVTDIEKMLIPNAVTYPGFLMVLLMSTTIMLLHFRPPWSFLLPVSGSFAWLNNYLWNSIVGCLVGFLLLLLVVIISRGGMALGDVKLAALIGLMVGFPMVLVGLFVAVITGGLAAIVLLIARRKGKKDPIPFGPFLCAGGLVAMFWGKELLRWYLSPLM